MHADSSILCEYFLLRLQERREAQRARGECITIKCLHYRWVNMVGVLQFEDTDFEQTSKITRAEKKKMYRPNLRSTFFIRKHESIESVPSQLAANQTKQVLSLGATLSANGFRMWAVGFWHVVVHSAIKENEKICKNHQIVTFLLVNVERDERTVVQLICLYFSFLRLCGFAWIRAVFETRTAPLKRVFETNPIATFERIAYFIKSFLCYSLYNDVDDASFAYAHIKVKQCVRNKETKKKKNTISYRVVNSARRLRCANRAYGEQRNADRRRNLKRNDGRNEEMRENRMQNAHVFPVVARLWPNAAPPKSLR